MSEDSGRMCERREGKWYCVSFEDYLLDGFAKALPVKEYLDGKLGYKFGINIQEQ